MTSPEPQPEKNEKPYDRDLSFVGKAVLWAGLIMIGMHIYQYFFPPPPKASPEEIKATLERIETLSASEAFTVTDGKPMMLYIYASWCSSCRALLPSMVKLENEGKLSHLNTRFISVDRDHYKLATYLAEENYDKVFTPYLLIKSNINSLPEIVSERGSSYDGRIPYTVLVNSEGRIEREEFGRPDWDEFLNAVKELD